MVNPAASLNAHPVADLFPMLAEDELAELAADIKQRGLLQPIVLDTEGRVLDGRNRLAACRIAGVEPTFDKFDGDDPDGYALAVNVTRRHLTQGQRAVVVAQLHKLCNYGDQSLLAHQHGVPQQRLSAALLIVEVSTDLADQVLSGIKSFDAAHKEAQEIRRKKQSDEAKLARLRADAPDLAALVIDELMKLDEAIAALEARISEERRQAQVETHLLCETVVAIAQMRGFSPGEKYNPAYALPGRAVTKEVISNAIETLGELMDIWEERKLT